MGHLVSRSETRNNIGSHARFLLEEALKIMSLERIHELEIIDPTPLPPWRTDTFSNFEIEPDRDRAGGGDTVQVGHRRLLRRLRTP